MPEAGMKTIPLYYCTMTPYDATFKGLHVIYPKENADNTIGEVLALQVKNNSELLKQKNMHMLHSSFQEDGKKYLKMKRG